MKKIIGCYRCVHGAIFNRLSFLEGIAPLLLRLYLIPIFWMAGSNKINFETLMPYPSMVDWFANPDWGLGLPFPALMAFLAGWIELLGAILLAAGLAVRWIAIPLMITMAVAAMTAHWDNGWQAIADPSAPFANERVMESVDRLDRAKAILREHGNYSWLTGRGSFVVLNNGIEFAATYFLMLLSLFFTGGGRYTSVDYWLKRCCQPAGAAPGV
jgi:uncharacterized membrane protein YphA (DoxX/SURF4 family)